MFGTGADITRLGYPLIQRCISMSADRFCRGAKGPVSNDILVWVKEQKEIHTNGRCWSIALETVKRSHGFYGQCTLCWRFIARRNILP